jgi:hypothetical protein
VRYFGIDGKDARGAEEARCTAFYYNSRISLRHPARRVRFAGICPVRPSGAFAYLGSFHTRGPDICNEQGVIMGRPCVKSVDHGPLVCKVPGQGAQGRPQVAKFGDRSLRRKEGCPV